MLYAFKCMFVILYIFTSDKCISMNVNITHKNCIVNISMALTLRVCANFWCMLT